MFLRTFWNTATYHYCLVEYLTLMLPPQQMMADHTLHNKLIEDKQHLAVKAEESKLPHHSLLFSLLVVAFLVLFVGSYSGSANCFRTMLSKSLFY